MTTQTISITAFGETHDVECFIYPSALRIESSRRVVVGRFPTGSKLHRSTLTLWKRVQNEKQTLRGPTAAVVNGEEYVADGTLYTHNSNRGRIVGWDRESFPEQLIAQWM